MAEEILENISDSIASVVGDGGEKKRAKGKNKGGPALVGGPAVGGMSEENLLWLGGAVALGLFLWSRRGSPAESAAPPEQPLPNSRMVERPPIPETPSPTNQPRVMFLADNFVPSEPAGLDPYYAAF